MAGEINVIILRGLNVDCSYLKASDKMAFRDAGYIWIVPDAADTKVSASDCAYERFIFTQAVAGDYSGSWGLRRT